MRTSCSGLMWPKAPTAPESLPTRICSAAASNRSWLRCISAYQFSNFSPNVVGSACWPWVRPTVGVSLNSSARAFKTKSSCSISSRRIAEAALIWIACAVSTTSLEVSPKCSQRDSGPTFSATAVVKAMTSCFTSASICWMRSRSKPPRSRIALAASAGTMPSSASTSLATVSTSSQARNLLSSLQMRPIGARV